MRKLARYIIFLLVFGFVVLQVHSIYLQEVAITDNGKNIAIEQKESVYSPQFDNDQVEANENFDQKNQVDNSSNFSNGEKFIQLNKTNILIIFLVSISIILLFILVWLISRKNEKINTLSVGLQDYKDKNRQKSHELTQMKQQKDQAQKSLANALETISESNDLKEAFLANMSHEIRTPLNGITGFSNLIHEYAKETDNEQLVKYSRHLLSSSTRLLSFLTNIIDLSRIEANDLNLTLDSCNIVQIARHAVESHIFTANEKKLEVIIDLQPCSPVVGNCRYLSRVINNIIDNSVKYTDSGFIKISTLNNLDKAEVIVIIEDSGIGISSDYLNHIFEFFRQESIGITRSFEGGGIALPLSKKLIDIMGGYIDIKSEKGVGTTVSIHLKKSFANNNKSKQKVNDNLINQQSSDLHFENTTVFLVEDDRLNSELITAYLVGYANVITAKNGVDAMEKISEIYNLNQRIDSFLIDINLPQEWDGISLMNEIQRRWPEYSSVPFIAQTAYAMKGDREKFLRAGFDEYVSKPILKKNLIAAIDNSIKTKFHSQVVCQEKA